MFCTLNPHCDSRYGIKGKNAVFYFSANGLLSCHVRQGAVLAMTRELAIVHAREGIRINSLCPYAYFILSEKYFLDVSSSKVDH